MGRAELVKKLGTVFEQQQAIILAEVIVEAYTDLVRARDFSELKDVVKELAEAQKRTEQRVEELAEAQKRTEQRVEELAEAQKRTEQRVEELAEAQKRTEQRVEELAEAQKRHEERLARLEAAVTELAEAQKRTEQRLEELAEIQKRHEERLNRLEATVAELAEAQKLMALRIAELTEAQKKTELQIQGLERRLRKVENKLSDIDGRTLEIRYRERAPSYFGSLLKKLRVVDLYSLEEDLSESLTPEEFGELLLLDLAVCGRLRGEGEPEVWLAVEISSVIDQNDVDRARKRADLLRKAGFQAIPVAAGQEVAEQVEEVARDQKVALVCDGRVTLWQEALVGLQAEN